MIQNIFNNEVKAGINLVKFITTKQTNLGNKLAKKAEAEKIY